MRHSVLVLTGLTALLLTAQPQGQNRTAPATPTPPTSQVPDRGRPTRITDEVPPFDFAAYFVGAVWRFEWDIPEGVLGPAGTLEGTVEYRHVEGPFFEATTKGTGPGGPFTIHEQIAYRPDGRAATRVVTDSRGLEYMQTAGVGGDLGGYYNMYYESAPFQSNGQTVRIKHAMRMLSPVRYRSNMTVSIDGGPFVNYGNPWFEKDM
jgi:hypothetical protein